MPRTRLFDLRHSSDRDSRPRDTRREPRNPSADECRHRRLAVWRQHENDVPVAAAVPLLNGELFARAHWPSEPNALGSYTCNQPGYFTTMEGWLGEPAGNLAFAGEHTDSFHNFQGFIEGAAESGIRAAEYLLTRIRKDQL